MYVNTWFHKKMEWIVLHVLCLALIDNYKLCYKLTLEKQRSSVLALKILSIRSLYCNLATRVPKWIEKKLKKFCFRKDCVHCRQNTLKFCVLYQGVYVSREIVSTVIKTRLLKSTGSQKIEFLPVNGLAHFLTALKIRRRTLIVLH